MHAVALGSELVDRLVQLLLELQRVSVAGGFEAHQEFVAGRQGPRGRSGAEDWNLRDALRLCELLRAQVPWAEPGAAAELLLLPRLRRAEDRRRAREVIRRRAT